MPEKRKIVDTVILPTMTYGAETWTLSNHQSIKQSINQSNFNSVQIPGKARLSGVTAESVFNSKNEEPVL